MDKRLIQVTLLILLPVSSFSFNSITTYKSSYDKKSHRSLPFISSTAILISLNNDEHTDPPPLYIDGTKISKKETLSSSQKAIGSNRSLQIQTSFDRITNHIYGANNQYGQETINATTMEMNKQMVLYGQTFLRNNGFVSDTTSDIDIYTSQMERVPGCVATVQIQTSLIPIKGDNDKKKSYRVHITGTADALLSQGLLAILSTALSGDEDSFQQTMCGRKKQELREQALTESKDKYWDGLSVEDVLSLDPEILTDKLKLRNLLSPGRNDGLASMLRVVQNQIRSVLNQNDDHNLLQNSNEKEPTAYLTNDGPTVAMLLSGGVDSSVALNLLTRQNYNVTAFYLKIWLEDELAHLGQCPWEDDYKTCQAICEHANVPLETISLQKEYKDSVIQYTVAEAKKGRTPNPDIMCNSRVKFGCFYDAIEGRGFDFVATGHYAQLVDDAGNDDKGGALKKKMRRAPDQVKDQSYFLSMLTQKQLSNVMFPIGKYTKKEVRALAEEFDLPNKHRPESQGLCFLGKVKFEEFLGAYLGENPGQILDASSTDVILGKHKGLWFHTIGQRKGIGKLLDPKVSAFGPWYIVAKDTKRNALFASNQYDEEAFARARSEFYVDDLTWISGSPPTRLMQQNKRISSTGNIAQARFNMKIRHGPKIVQGTLQLIEKHDAQENESVSGKIILDNKDGGLAPGQFIVFYGSEEEGDNDDMECFGAGVISERHWASFLLEASEAETIVTK